MDLIKFSVSIISLIIIRVCCFDKISIATLIVAILAILEATYSLTSVLKHLFSNRLEK